MSTNDPTCNTCVSRRVCRARDAMGQVLMLIPTDEPMSSLIAEADVMAGKMCAEYREREASK